MQPLYDDIGIEYSAKRCTDPRIARQIDAELDGARRIVNIGAGTGSYEPEAIELVAVEPSSEMISQRQPGSHPVEQAYAHELPFADNSFSHAMTVLSMHHWEDRARAFDEINRVATDRFVAVTWDPDAEPFWLTRDYFPGVHEIDVQIFPALAELEKHFDQVQMKTLEIPDDCQDGFLAAYWKRPRAYLDSAVRRSISGFAKIGDLSVGLQKLEQDLESGAWANRNQAILDSPVLDAGYRIITARIKD